MNLPALFSRLTSIQSITGLGANVLAALKKPVGTAGSLQLYGDPLTPAALTLADVTTRVTGLNEIGLKNAEISIGDNVTLGGNVLAPQPFNTLKKITVIPASRLNCEVGNVTVTGDITQSGQLTVQWQNYSPTFVSVTFNIPVIAGETAYSYNRKIVAAANADSTFSATHVAYNCGGIIQIQDKTPNLSRLYAFNVVNGTAAGVLASAVSKSVQLAFVELGEFQILATNAVLNKKFLLTGKASVLSAGVPAGFYLGLRASEESFLVAAGVGLNFPITSGGGSITQNYYDFNSPAKFEGGNGCPAGYAYLTNSPYSGSGDGFITETALASNSIAAVRNLTPNTPGGTSYGYSKMGRASSACMMIACAINLTGTASVTVGVDLQLTPQ